MKPSWASQDLVVDSIHALWCRCQIFPRNHHIKLHLQQCKGPKTNWSRLKKNGVTGRHLHCKLGFSIKRTSRLVNLTRSILICHRYIDYLILCSIIWTQILFGLQSIVVNIWSVNKCREKFKIENNCEKFEILNCWWKNCALSWQWCQTSVCVTSSDNLRHKERNVRQEQNK